MAERYQVIILGGGPAGLTAALYAGRARLRTLLVERGLFGGQITMAHRVENFPGFPEGIEGEELGERMRRQAERAGAEVLTTEVTRVTVADGIKQVHTSRGEFQAPALILALGADHKKLGVPGEEELLGRGVSYCAFCDAPFFHDQVVAVAGGGNTALTDALYLTKHARQVLIVHRRRQLRAEAVLQELAFADPKLGFVWDSVVERIEGTQKVEGLRLRRVDTGETSLLAVDGVFIAVGTQPNTGLVKDLVELSPSGHVLTNDMMETSAPGIFVCGDVRHNAIQQAITSAGDGATAAIAALHYLRQHPAG